MKRGWRSWRCTGAPTIKWIQRRVAILLSVHVHQKEATDWRMLQVAVLKGQLRGAYKIRALSLIDKDWTSLLKTTRTRFIIPDQDIDEARMEELEIDTDSEAATTSSGATGKSIVTGSTPEVCACLSLSKRRPLRCVPVFPFPSVDP
jgi:hypothetical protein